MHLPACSRGLLRCSLHIDQLYALNCDPSRPLIIGWTNQCTIFRSIGKPIYKKRITEPLEEWNGGERQPIIIYFDSKVIIRPTLVYMDALVSKCITEVLSNVMHRSSQIPCPWPGLPAHIHADAWMRIVQADVTREITVEIVNRAPADGPRPKQTFASVHLNNVGGSIEISSDGRLYAARISIPTVAGLASEVAS